jgi:hypothetical protein
MTTLNKVLVGVLVVVIALLLWQFYHAKNLENKLAIESQNKAALLDSVRTMKTKNGELESAKMTLAGSLGDLKKMNAELAEELKKEKGKVRYITKVEVVYQNSPDSAAAVISMQDSVGSIRTDLEDSCRIFRGHTSFVFSKGVITKPMFVVEKDEFNLKLITGLRERERDKQLEIFVRSSCPNVTIGDIQGAVIDPNDPLIKPKKSLVTWRDALMFSGGLVLGWFAHSK